MKCFSSRRAILGGLFLIARSFSQPAHAEIHVSDFGMGQPVIGILGKRLGERTVISGEYKLALLSNPLAVTMVDGKTLPHPAIIMIRGKIELKEGVHYEFEGYESGEFASEPTWLAPGMQQPFQYYPFFVVTKIIQPAPAP